MIVMGCDASLTCTGISAINTEHISASGVPDNTQVFTFAIEPRKMFGVERLRYIRNEFSRMLLLLKPVVVVFEGYAAGSVWGREAAGEIGGILRLRTYDEETPFIVASPTALKKFATGKGVGDKSIIRACVERRWGLVSDKLSHDEVDAYVLMMIGAAWVSDRDLPVYQADVIKAIKANREGVAGGKERGVKAAAKGRPLIDVLDLN